MSSAAATDAAPRHRYVDFAAAHDFLAAAQDARKLGAARADPPPLPARDVALQTLPAVLLLAQLLWSSLVTLLVFFLARRRVATGTAPTTLSTDFWSSTHLTVPPSVVAGVGWALFVLLAFFLRQAVSRHTEAATKLRAVVAHSVHISRALVQHFARGLWHDGDIDRAVAHLVAFPVALKMALRDETEDESQLRPLLHEADLRDLMDADWPHIQCLRVVRAYIDASHEDGWRGRPFSGRTTAGDGGRLVLMQVVEDLESLANALLRIQQFRPAVGFVNHLHIFVFIWLFFLPLNLVTVAGWFTPLFATLLAYGVGMLHRIAHTLNQPFGFRHHNIKLNSAVAQYASQILAAYVEDDYELEQLLTPPPAPPVSEEDAIASMAAPSSWLDGAPSLGTQCRPPQPNLFRAFVTRVNWRAITLPLVMFTLWTLLIVFLTWWFSRTSSFTDDDQCRWWCLYLPVNSDTVNYVSLITFVMFAFWMDNAHERFERGLRIWQSPVRVHVAEVGVALASVAPRGYWHSGDRRRVFSLLAALPVTIKQHLRGSRDVTELREVLAPGDLSALHGAKNLPRHVLNVLYAYCTSLDKREAAERPPHLVGTLDPTHQLTIAALWKLEKAVGACDAIRLVPIPRAFTWHMGVLIATWLALLPLSVVRYNGFLTILFVLPFAFIFICLFAGSLELADPFGLDRRDIHLGSICAEIRADLFEIYHAAGEDWRDVVRRPSQLSDAREQYDRSLFNPRVLSQREHFQQHMREFREKNPTLLDTIKKAIRTLPPVSLKAQLLAMAWFSASVAASYGFSFLWSDETRSTCRFWCSPLDISSAMTANIGIGLFLLLTFRASEGLQRYRYGARLMLNVERNLRNVAIEFCQSIPDGALHENDKERFVAHVLQVPLCFRDLLHATVESEEEMREGLLIDEDYEAMRHSRDPLMHLLRVVETYAIALDQGFVHPTVLKQNASPSPVTTSLLLDRIKSIREETTRALGIKAISSAVVFKTQRRGLLTLWLTVLPLSMTASSGWASILWSSIVSYGILALDSIAVQLMDPYGNDMMDIPVELYCRRAASGIIEGVTSVEWDSISQTREPSDRTGRPYIGAIVDGTHVRREYTLPSFSEFETRAVDGPEFILQFWAPMQIMVKPSLLVHFMRSMPWWALGGVSLWSTLAVGLSRFINVPSVETTRWWRSGFAIGKEIAKYLSIASFMMLNFYLTEALKRWRIGKRVWVEKVQAGCASLAAQWLCLTEPAKFYEGDQQRIFAHIAALPLVLRQELRDTRDVRELCGLFSSSDLAEIQCAPRMSQHCLDVIRSHFFAALNTIRMAPNSGIVLGMRLPAMLWEYERLEEGIADLFFVKLAGISPGFVHLTVLLLATWFLLLPIIIAELSGWFTLVWMPLIAYGVLGMFRLASELEHPFGKDVNNIDLDATAIAVVRQVLTIHKTYRGSLKTLIRKSPGIVGLWESNERSCGRGTDNIRGLEAAAEVEIERADRGGIRRFLGLAVYAGRRWMFPLLATWAVVSVVAARAVHDHWGLPPGVEAECAPWWCSRIAVPEEVKEYVGFALFSLMALLLYDSHDAYVSGLRVWRERLVGSARAFCTEFFNNARPGAFHDGDRERIAGHIAAFGYACKGELGNEGFHEELRRVVAEEDAVLIESAPSPGDYCLDVVRAYVTAVDDVIPQRTNDIPSREALFLHHHITQMRQSLHESRGIREGRLPFGCVTHASIFLNVWVMLLPLGIVEQTGWLAIAWTVVVAYGLIGIETWARELSDPFGNDMADLPMKALCKELHATAAFALQAFQDPERSALRPRLSNYTALLSNPSSEQLV